MYVVIFEVYPHASQKNRYFELAAQLRETLVQQPGFVQIEHSEPIDEGKSEPVMLESEEAITKGQPYRVWLCKRRQGDRLDSIVCGWHRWCVIMTSQLSPES